MLLTLMELTNALDAGQPVLDVGRVSAKQAVLEVQH